MQTRMLLIIAGFICCFIGAQFLIVDAIILHEGLWPVVDQPADSESMGRTAGRRVDLPDSGGFALVAAGVVCLLFSMGLKRFKEK